MVGGLSGSNLAIGISLIMRDQFTGRANAAAASLHNLDKKTQAMQRRQLEFSRNMNAVGAGIGAMAIRGMGQWVKVGAEFDYMMTYVNQIATKKGGIGFDKLSMKAKTLGSDTMFTARQVGDAMKFMAMAGQNTEEIYNNITAAVTLAGATMERLEGKGGTSDIMTNIMRGFQIEASEKNSMYVADVLTTAITSANTNLWDLHEAMKYTISTAKDLNVSLEETAAMVMMAGDAGIQGTMAGTAAENMLRYLTKAIGSAATGRQTNAIKALGMSPEDFKDAEGNLLSISAILHKVTSNIRGMSNVNAQNVLIDLFGVRGKREASLVTRNIDIFDKYIDKLTSGSSGRATAGLNAQMGTLQGHGIQLASAWEVFKISFTEALTPVLLPLLSGMTKLLKVVTGLSQTKVGQWLMAIGAGFLVIKTVSMAYKAVVLSLRLAHMSMATSFGTQAGAVVGGYSRMTAAAHRYNMAATGTSVPMMFAGARGRAGKWMASRGVGKYSGMTKGGSQYSIGKGGRSTFISKGSAPTGWSMAGGGGKLGKFMGRASLPAMIGGMGLQMASDYAGDNNWGKGLGIAGDTLGGAGTGAMIGSIIPGIGTAIGGIVGGVGGLLWGLYNRLSEAEDEIEKAKAEDKSTDFSSEAWRAKARNLLNMQQGEWIWGKGFQNNVNSMSGTNRQGAMNHLNQGGTYMDGIRDPNRIIINIDGNTAFDKVIRDHYYETLLNMGGN